MIDPTQQGMDPNAAPAEDPMAGISFPMDSQPQEEQPTEDTGNSDQYKEELKDMLEAIKEKVAAYNQTKEVASGQTEQIKSDLIDQVFGAMAAAGVDLENPEEIQKYMSEMADNEPEKYQLFTSIMEKIMDTEENPEDQAQEPTGEPISEPMPGQAESTPQMPGAPQAPSAPLDLSQVPQQ